LTADARHGRAAAAALPLPLPLRSASPTCSSCSHPPTTQLPTHCHQQPASPPLPRHAPRASPDLYPCAPPPPRQDPSLVLLGFSWDSSDEAKMQRTFGFGRSSFASFLDLQHVASSLGYSRCCHALLPRPVAAAGRRLPAAEPSC
jgi:hypothetical protein